MNNNCSFEENYEEGVIRCRRSKSLLSDISKYLNLPNPECSKPNVELGLEIEINESVQRVLKDETSSDDLLAVTIIRPSDSDLVHETTVALNKDDVKEFIAMVEKHRTKYPIDDKKPSKHKKFKKEKEKSKEKDLQILKDRKPKPKPTKYRRAVKSVHQEEKRTKTSKEPSRRSSKVSKMHLSTFGDSAKQVYTTINTFDKLKEVLPCQNKHRTEKPGVPCVCQNCGIMDVLVQSQKGPVVEFPPLEEVRQPDRDEKRRAKREKREPRCAQPSSLDIDILKEINVRISHLEKRLSVQEDTAVSKDYLKHVLHKIFAQYRND